MNDKWIYQPGMEDLIQKTAKEADLFPGDVVKAVEAMFLGIKEGLNADVGVIRIRRIGNFYKDIDKLKKR